MLRLIGLRYTMIHLIAHDVQMCRLCELVSLSSTTIILNLNLNCQQFWMRSRRDQTCLYNLRTLEWNKWFKKLQSVFLQYEIQPEWPSCGGSLKKDFTVQPFCVGRTLSWARVMNRIVDCMMSHKNAHDVKTCTPCDWSMLNYILIRSFCLKFQFFCQNSWAPEFWECRRVLYNLRNK